MSLQSPTICMFTRKKNWGTKTKEPLLIKKTPLTLS